MSASEGMCVEAYQRPLRWWLFQDGCVSLAATRNVAKPIGIFDSGLGGLTVARAIHAALPAEDLAMTAPEVTHEDSGAIVVAHQNLIIGVWSNIATVEHAQAIHRTFKQIMGEHPSGVATAILVMPEAPLMSFPDELAEVIEEYGIRTVINLRNRAPEPDENPNPKNSTKTVSPRRGFKRKPRK